MKYSNFLKRLLVSLFYLYLNRWKWFPQSKQNLSESKRVDCSKKHRPPNDWFSSSLSLGITYKRIIFSLFLQAVTRWKLIICMINSHFVSQHHLWVQACTENLLSVNWAVPLNTQVDWESSFFSAWSNKHHPEWLFSPTPGCLFKFNKCRGNLMDHVVAKAAQWAILSLMFLS